MCSQHIIVIKIIYKQMQVQKLHQQILFTEPKIIRKNQNILDITKGYKTEQWENFSKALLKNKAKAKKIKFQIKYKQFAKQRRQRSPILSDKSTKKDREFQMPSIRSLVSQKHYEEDELRKTISEYNFHLAEKERTMRKFKIASQKYKKIISVRENHLRDVTQLKQDKAINQQQINSQKQKLLSFTKNDKSSKYRSLEKSRLWKRSLADEVRFQSQLNKAKFSQQQQEKSKGLKYRYEKQKSQEKMASLKNLEVIQIKKFEADKIRNRRLQSQMLERDLIHRQRIRLRTKTNRKISFMKTITDSLNKKIEQFQIFSKEIHPEKRSKSLSISTQM